MTFMILTIILFLLGTNPCMTLSLKDIFKWSKSREIINQMKGEVSSQEGLGWEDGQYTYTWMKSPLLDLFCHSVIVVWHTDELLYLKSTLYPIWRWSPLRKVLEEKLKNGQGNS